jgi:hypothetical protein
VQRWWLQLTQPYEAGVHSSDVLGRFAVGSMRHVSQPSALYFISKPLSTLNKQTQPRYRTMGLVDYSDSEDSDNSEAPAISQAPAISSKPAFQKVVDRTNPGKIRVSLPQTGPKLDTNGDEPPAKRAKMGGGAFGGFNSFLPAPKRTGVVGGGALGGGNANKKSGLGAGVSLKTGAAPGFSRELEESEGPDVEAGYERNAANEGGLSLPAPKTSTDVVKPAEEVKLVGKPLMFKPLSVARNPAKKKKQQPSAAAVSATERPPITQPKPKQKVSLFSVSAEADDVPSLVTKGEYEPMIYGAAAEEDTVNAHDDLVGYSSDPYNSSVPPPHAKTQSMPAAGPQSLSDIASDLGLSAADRRQLFGRQKGTRGTPSATKIINFNTDQEYLHNEELRASGEQVMHNPVRAIAPGKHSLKQLVNAAASQKDALEESFAKGKNNRAEASSRYGW